MRFCQNVKLRAHRALRRASDFFGGLIRDFQSFDRRNEDETRVLNCRCFSSYRGVPVIRTGGRRSGSFGVIFLTRETNSRSCPEDVLRHEYGHTRQLRQLGVLAFAVHIGIPSWRERGGGDYYSRPWEITADVLGGVRSRQHGRQKLEDGFRYLNAHSRRGRHGYSNTPFE